MLTNAILPIVLSIILVLSLIEFRKYLKEYFHFRTVGIRTKAKVISCFNGKSNGLLKSPIRSLPIVEVDLGDKKSSLKTFENQYSPLTTFAFYGSEVTILLDQNNNEYCMIDWKSVILFGAVLNISILFGIVYFICTINLNEV